MTLQKSKYLAFYYATRHTNSSMARPGRSGRRIDSVKRNFIDEIIFSVTHTNSVVAFHREFETQKPARIYLNDQCTHIVSFKCRFFWWIAFLLHCYYGFVYTMNCDLFWNAQCVRMWMMLRAWVNSMCSERIWQFWGNKGTDLGVFSLRWIMALL